eukprot:3399013-Rhodomonas_salina.1
MHTELARYAHVLRAYTGSASQYAQRVRRSIRNHTPRVHCSIHSVCVASYRARADRRAPSLRSAHRPPPGHVTAHGSRHSSHGT